MADAITAGRTERAAAVEELAGLIRGAQGLVFMNAQSLNSVDTFALRVAMRPTGARLKVVKNRLMRIACEREGVAGCDGLLRQNTAVAFLGDDPIAAIKALSGFAGEHDKLALKGGWMDRKALDLAELKSLATLPGRADLLTKAAVVMKAPFSRAARDFQSVYVKMALLLRAAAKKAPQA